MKTMSAGLFSTLSNPPNIHGGGIGGTGNRRIEGCVERSEVNPAVLTVFLSASVAGQYFLHTRQITLGINTMAGHFTCHFDMYSHAMP